LATHQPPPPPKKREAERCYNVKIPEYKYQSSKKKKSITVEHVNTRPLFHRTLTVPHFQTAMLYTCKSSYNNECDVTLALQVVCNQHLPCIMVGAAVHRDNEPTQISTDNCYPYF